MAVVLRFPDRIAAGSTETPKSARGNRVSPTRAGEIVILPCIRREALDRTIPAGMPAQLQA